MLAWRSKESGSTSKRCSSPKLMVLKSKCFCTGTPQMVCGITGPTTGCEK